MSEKTSGPVIVASESDLVCITWFERDRKNVRLETSDGKEIFSLWDDDVGQAIEDGFLATPRTPRPSDEDWLPHAIEYAKSQGLIAIEADDLLTFEVTAAGFDASTDETDGRVFWVKAKDEAVVQSAIEGTGATLSRIHNFSTDIDYVLPRDAGALREELEALRQTSVVAESPRAF